MFRTAKQSSALSGLNPFFKQCILGMAFLSLVTLAPGCSRVSPQPAEKEELPADESEIVEELSTAPTESDSATYSAQEPSRELSSVELLWQVPAEPVETYHLRYGTHPDTLTHQVKIQVTELDQIQHPEYGPLFRYIIPSVPADQTVYFTIQAENKFGISPESPVQEVAPQ